MNANAYDKTVYMTIKEACDVSGYSQQYVRMHLLKGNKVPYKRENIEGTQIERVLIEREPFMKRLEGLQQGRKGRTTLYMNEDETAKVREYLKSLREQPK